ncbi:RteC domain-containing protein [Aequorivita sp. 609]|uniref:RteC domain-containing protein n=1 Tax=Aequorivita TaxID=153265 RepID=UPI00160AB3D1|nr:MULTISPECIES: RteC domain-containing protein [Aequorivita]MBB6681364.1 RteC domain-containing protein [Aequorivita sp. 609]
MDCYYNQLNTLEDKLADIKKEPFIYKRAELALAACQKCLANFRLRVYTNGFNNENDETTFFKHIKPKIVGYIYFYINLIKIERQIPYLKNKDKDKYLYHFVLTLKKFLIKHREFHEYYLRGQTYNDKIFFCRNLKTINLHNNAVITIVDASFNTSHDLILARIIGNVITIDYIKQQYWNETAIHATQIPKLKWTGAKVDLIELVYALHYSGLISNGQAGLIEIAKALENLFAIKLGDIYRTFLEIRNRKSSQTKLLDTLKVNLINKMIEADG